MAYFHHSALRRQRLLYTVSALYMTLVMLIPGTAAPVHVWLVAAGFCLFMTLSYMAATYGHRAFLGPETLIASFLIAAAVFGLVVSPFFLVLAVMVHGLWRFSAVVQAGVPVIGWSSLGALLADMSYGAVLLYIWLG